MNKNKNLLTLRRDRPRISCDSLPLGKKATISGTGGLTMKTQNKRFGSIALVVALFLVPAVILAGCSKPAEFTAPSATSISTTPLEMTPQQLWDEYQADPAGTEAKYAGRKIHFPRVTVEKMSFLGEPIDADLYVQEGMIKFRVDIPDQIIPIRDGYIVEVVGSLWKMQYNFLIVNDCWIRSIDPPGGNPNPPPEY